ncbi:S-layer homology domain-containing protein [Bacillus benzoevorans]|nr:S-layer homology domain-containing protein [Bacillus benzoevorans]
MHSTKKHFFSRIICLPLLVVLLILSQAGISSAATFSDVSKNQFFYNAVEEASSKGYIVGYSDGTFKPYETLSRLHGVLILSRVLNTNTDNITQQVFTDVPPSYVHYKAITGIARDGIIKGYSDNTFRRYDPLTRGQMALALYRTFDFTQHAVKPIPFTDVPDKYKEAVTALYSAGVTLGKEGTTFGTYDTITRGEFTVLLMNAFKASKRDMTAPGISFTSHSLVDGVLDLLDLKTDLTVRFTFGTDVNTGARVGDKLVYSVSSTKQDYDNTIVLKQADLDKGYAEAVIGTSALQNLLGGLTGGLLGDVTGILDASAGVESAGLGDTLGAVLGVLPGLPNVPVLNLGETVTGVVTDTVGTATDSTDVVTGLLHTDKLLGLPVTGLVDGAVELVDGVVVTVVDGVITNIVGAAADGLLSGSEKVTITVHLEDDAANRSDDTSGTYQFQVTDLLGL